MFDHRTPLLLTLLLGALGATACTSSVHRQYAVVPAPRAPRAAGPMLGHLQSAVEAGGSFSATRPDDRTRAEGARGHYVVDKAGFGRASLGLTGWMELGTSLDYAHSTWSTAAAADLATASPHDAHVLWGSLELRALFYKSDIFTMGGVAELSVGSVPHQLEVDGAEVDRSSQLQMVVRTGPFGRFHFADLIHIGVGTSAQTQPSYWGQKQSHSAGALSTPQLVAMLWLDAAVTLGPVALIGKVHAPIASTDDWATRAPIGGEVSARMMF